MLKDRPGKISDFLSATHEQQPGKKIKLHRCADQRRGKRMQRACGIGFHTLKFGNDLIIGYWHCEHTHSSGNSAVFDCLLQKIVLSTYQNMLFWGGSDEGTTGNVSARRIRADAESR
jgi:hypothetical protein